MSKFIIDADAASGEYSRLKYDAAEDKLLLEQGQVVDHIVEANKREFTADKDKPSDGWGNKVASIPLHIYFELRRQGIAQDPKAFKKWLNDPDNRAFRTAPGRV